MYMCVFVIRGGPRVHQSHGDFFCIYALGRAPQRTTTTECTHMLCIELFQLVRSYMINEVIMWISFMFCWLILLLR